MKAPFILLILFAALKTNPIAVNAPDPYPCVKLVKDINPNGNSVRITNPFYDNHDNTYGKRVAEFKGAVYFGGTGGLINGSDSGVQLWKTDGTEAGTAKVKTIYPPPASYLPAGNADPSDFTIVGETLFFVATTFWGPALWKTDGTAAGTVLVKGFYLGNAAASRPGLLRNVNGSLFFCADGDGNSYREVWKSDGTAGGTMKVLDLNGKNVTVSNENACVVLNGVYYFVNWTDTLWRTDGTPFGTYMVKDLGEGILNTITDMTLCNGKLFFSGYDQVNGYQIWKSDGTAAGTQRISNIQSDNEPVLQYHRLLFTVGTTLYFSSGSHQTDVCRLWKSDGTPAGTVALGTFTGQAVISSFGSLNGALYFSMRTPQFGSELWKSNGTSAGTYMLKNISTVLDEGNSDLRGSLPYGFTEKGGKLYFSANDFVHGRELWVTDGTTAGTNLVKEVNPVSDANPVRLISFKSKLLFWADDGTHGIELHAYGMCGTGQVTAIPPGRVIDGKAGNPDLEIRLLGNPVRHVISAQVYGVKDREMLLMLTDLQGNPMASKSVERCADVEYAIFDIGRFTTGTFLLSVRAGSDSRTVRVVKAP